MADLTPYEYPDGDARSQERFIEQQLAHAAQARRVASQDRTVERQPIGDLIRLDRYEREKQLRASRFRTVYTRHSRS
jgi:hypothetical protein